VDPYSGEPCVLERILEVLTLCRSRNEANAGHTVCLGFQRWKRPFARAFLSSTQGSLHFISGSGRAVELARRLDARLVVWAANEPEDLACRARAAGTPLLRREDGFLRSAGLGSNFARPYSLILDSQGIYFNAGVPSDLEFMLEAGGLPPELLAKARRLREEIVRLGLTKYNLAGDTPTFEIAQGRSILLVPGQVADDASVRLGGAGIPGNLELLRAVRQASPEAFVVYKPHPDVLAGNRKGHVPAADLDRLCDAVIDSVSMNELLPHVHEVHTLSSLTGFEALLRGLPVCTYGAPFYAGWGLTTDRAVFPRRTRRVSLDELVAGTLLLYPRYFDWESGLPCEAEVLLTRLAAQSRQKFSGFLTQRLSHWLEYIIRILHS
jgi:capsular polysaccharide export protein